MGLGYPSAKALARLAGRIDHAQVQRLLESENIWLRAGALAGLTEARAPGIELLLREILETHPSGIVFDHARVGLARLEQQQDGAQCDATRKIPSRRTGCVAHVGCGPVRRYNSTPQTQQ
jgi:hypothetical protein